jgi:hypothetical protein
MKIRVSGCKFCGGPLTVVEHQFLTNCHYCDSKFYVKQDLPPAVVLRPDIKKEDAKNIVLKELKHKEIASNFLKNSYFERAVLLYLPFFEARGIKAGYIPSSSISREDYTYLAYDYLEIANDLNDQAIDSSDFDFAEELILNSQHLPFNPVEMRTKGVVLPAQNIQMHITNTNPQALEAVESHNRLIYIPIWEISYSYQGILFKSYLSATDGRVIKIQGLRSHFSKLFFALTGLLALAIILGRGIYLGGMTLIFAAIFGLPVMAILFPFFWEQYAFQEIVEKKGNTFQYKTINFTENSMVKLSRQFVDQITGKKEIKPDQNHESSNQS